MYMMSRSSPLADNIVLCTLNPSLQMQRALPLSNEHLRHSPV